MPNQSNSGNKRARSSELTIRVNMGNAIGINKTILEALNRPVSLNFWWGESKKVLAISAAGEPTNYSVPVPDFFYGTRNGSKIRNWKLMRAIKILTGWEDNSIHLLVGDFFPDLNMIAFRADGVESEVEYGR